MARKHNPSAPRLGALGWIALAACLAVQAESEWSLATALGWPKLIAAGIPVALGAYAIRALHAGREILLCVSTMIATVSASRLLHAGMIPLTPWLMIAVSAVPAFVMWRVHALGAKAAADAPADAVTDAPTLPVTGPSALPTLLVVPAPRPAAIERPVTPPMPKQPPAVSAPVTPVEQPLTPTLHNADVDLACDLISDKLRDDRPAAIVACLYVRLAREPVTAEIRAALAAESLPHADGTCRETRKRARAAVPELAAYPTRLAVTA